MDLADCTKDIVVVVVVAAIFEPCRKILTVAVGSKI